MEAREKEGGGGGLPREYRGDFYTGAARLIAYPSAITRNFIFELLTRRSSVILCINVITECCVALRILRIIPAPIFQDNNNFNVPS